MFLLLHAFNSLASHISPIHTRSPSTALQRERKMSSQMHALANTPAPTRYGCTFTWSASTSLAASMVQSHPPKLDAHHGAQSNQPRCLKPIQTPCSPRRVHLLRWPSLLFLTRSKISLDLVKRDRRPPRSVRPWNPIYACMPSLSISGNLAPHPKKRCPSDREIVDLALIQTSGARPSTC